MADPTADAPRRKKGAMHEHPKHNFGPEGAPRAYTVIGIYDDTRQRCCFHVLSPSVADAIESARMTAGYDFEVAAVLSGYHYALDVNDEERT